MATKKAEREKRAKERERKDVSAKWQAACVPPDIRRPWDVFQEDVSYTWIESLTGEDRSSDHPDLAIHEELRAVQRLGALQAFQALPACRQRDCAEVSLQELSAFAAWSATCGPADAMERVAAWTGLEADIKAGHVPHNWRAVLAKDPKWHVLIADDVKEEVDVPIGAAPALGGAPARVSSPSAQTPPKPPLPPALVAADGSYPAYALKIKQPWMGHILRGEKIWEIRGEVARVIGRVALFEAGAMHFVGLATIVESNLVTDADMAANVDKHCIEDWDTNPMVAKYRERKGIFAYVLSDVVNIEPVAANLGSSVIWSILANWLTMPSAPNAAGATRVGGVGKTSTAKARGGGRKSKPGAVDGDKKLQLHKPAGADAVASAADDDKKSSSIKPVHRRPACASSRPRESPAVTGRPARGRASGVSPAAGTSTAVEGQGRRPRGSNRTRRLEALAARYSWAREDGPPPASEAELQSLADQMARLRREKQNFARPERADGERLARAEAMLHIMRGKARAGFGGGRAMATHGLTLNKRAGLAFAKRARKLALDLEKRFNPLDTPSVLIEEGIALLDAD